MINHFENVDRILNVLGISTSERNIIYSFIAVILHLGNIEFEDADSGAIVKETTKIHVSIAARLLKLSADEFENAFLYRTIEVANSKIQ